MEPYIDVVKLEFMKYVEQHPNPEDVVSYLLQNTFDGPPAMVGMVQRAVRTLAEQLNASDAHFILEVIQNFEDNEYKNALPTMFFHLDGDKLYVACNEIGMKATDVYALCNVGDSTKKTKKDDAHGYLGEKGIGFKSIFKVAHTVQVYSSYASRDQMWKFDLTETPRKGIGYIVPGLLESVPSQVTSVLEHVCRDTRRPGGVGGTCLVLLLKPHKVELVAKQIKQLSPETIMFLRHIHKVKIQYGAELVTVKAEKSSLGFPPSFQSSSALHCKLHSKSKTKDEVQEYLIFQNIYDMKTAPCKEREGMEKRSISIAIPTLSQSNGFRGKIFAYLPTGQETLLPFHVNADFLLTASRNDFLMDHKWNNLLFNHVVFHVGLAATYLSAMSQVITLVDVMQLIPTLPHPNSFAFLHRLILEVLAPLPIFPVVDHQERVRADACVIAPSELFPLLKPGHPLPASPMLLDIVKASGFQLHAPVLGVRWADKPVLEAVIQCMLPKSNETPDPAWFCALYLFMASHDYWKAGRTQPVTKLPILLLSNGSLVSFTSTVYHQSAKELYPLRKWWDNAPMLSNSALPKPNDQLQLVRAWLEANKIHKLNIRSASRFITDKLRSSCSAEDILEATITIFTYHMSSSFSASTLPFVSSNNEVVRPPFTKSILAPDNKFLRLYEGSDFAHFHVVNRTYLDPRYKQQLQSLFPIAHAPPLPYLFSWMKHQNQEAKSLSASLLLELLYETSKAPSEAIIQFLNSNEWLPTTKGKTAPRKAFIPSPELLEIFAETVPFVIDDIYQNELAKSALLKHTKVNRAATTTDVLALLRYYQENKVNDLNSILPLLKYLLEKKAMPPIPFAKSLEDDWEWKGIDDLIWVKESIPEISTKRTNMKESKLDLSVLRKLFPKHMKRYSNEECTNAYKKLITNSSNQVDVVEKVLLIIYKRFPKDLSGMPNLRVWCGHFHQFQPPQEVLFNDQSSIAKRFAANQLKSLWFPKEIEAKSKKIEIASLLQVNSISSKMIDVVESKRLPQEPTVPITPLFGRFVRSALCRWHFNKCRNEWDRGNPPERLQELLKTRLEEAHVIELMVLKGVKVNGEVKKSSAKTAFKAYLDHFVDPPVLYHNIREGEEQVVEEFLEYLARALKIGDNNKDSFELTMRKAILRHNSNTDFLSRFPNIPSICKDASSSAYFTESDKSLQLKTTTEPSVVGDEKSIDARISEVAKEIAQPNNSAHRNHSLMKRLQALTLEKAAQEATMNGSVIYDTSDPFHIPTKETTKVPPKQTKVVPKETTPRHSSKSAKGPPPKNNYQNVFYFDDFSESLPGIHSQQYGRSAGQNRSSWYDENRTPFSSTRIIPVFSPQSVPFQKRSSAPRDSTHFFQSSLSPNFENLGQRDGSLPGVPRIVVDRPNQAEVRAAAIERYGGCIITGTSITDLVQAAHIKPWSTGECDVDDDDNIILLRSDIHLMLDNDPAYLYFTPSSLPGHIKVNFTGGAQDDPNYSNYNDTDIRLPDKTIELLLEYGPVPPDYYSSCG